MRGFELNPLCGNDQRDVDIVFVHGLTGDSKRTWGEEDLANLWPNELCKATYNTERPCSVRVWLAGYPSPLFERLHEGKIEQLITEEGNEALRELVKKKLGDKPIIFVAHSLGGLLVKAILCAAAKERGNGRSILEKTTGVVFLATPHAGSDKVRIRYLVPHLARLTIALLWFLLGLLVPPLADVHVGPAVLPVHLLLFRVAPGLVAALMIWFLRPSRHVKLLDPGNKELRDLRDTFRKVLRDRPADRAPITVLAMYETKAIQYWGIPLGIMVSWSSADPGIDDCTPQAVNANHVEICKPAALENSQLKEKIQTLVDYATVGRKRPVFRQKLEDLLRDEPDTNELLEARKSHLQELVKRGDFRKITTEGDTRRIVEVEARNWLRDGIKNELFRPTDWELQKAVLSPFELDWYVRYIWLDAQMDNTLPRLTKNATEHFDQWSDSGDSGNSRTLMPFYRAMRTIDEMRNSDPPQFLAEGRHLNGELIRLAEKAYKRLKQADDGSATAPDADGATRWLLFKICCMARLAGAGLAFVADFVGSDNRENRLRPGLKTPPEKMRKGFEDCLKQLEASLDRIRKESIG